MKNFKINKNILEETFWVIAEKQVVCPAKYENILNFEIRFDQSESMPLLENVPGYFHLLLNWRLE